MNFSWDIFKIL